MPGKQIRLWLGHSSLDHSSFGEDRDRNYLKLRLTLIFFVKLQKGWLGEGV